jgi:hypothetical protein
MAKADTRGLQGTPISERVGCKMESRIGAEAIGESSLKCLYRPS